MRNAHAYSLLNYASEMPGAYVLEHSVRYCPTIDSDTLYVLLIPGEPYPNLFYKQDTCKQRGETAARTYVLSSNYMTHS